MSEDIEFVKRNSTEDAIVLFFDSSLRNKTIDPSPSSYSVTFDDPIKWVHGFQVLDASLPNTMYVVDAYNNTLAVSLVAAAATSGPGFLAEISRSKTFAGIYNSASQPSNVCCVSSFSGSEATGNVGPFWVFVRSVIPAVPLADVTSHTSFVENYVFTYDHRQLYVPVSRTDVVPVLSGGDFALVASTTVPGTYDVVGYTAFGVSEATYTALVVSAVQTFTVETRAIQIPVGNYDLRSLRAALASALAPLGIAVGNASNPDTLQSKYTLSCQTLFVINEAGGGLADNLGYDFAPVAASTQSLPFACVTVGDNPNNFQAVFDPVANAYTMTSPGIVNLLGQRSVLLRCPEIEMNMGSFTSSRYAVGLGLFKMGVNPNGVANTRFDFVSFSVAPFHPIEKISKLTFSFETIDQQPYDFKGVNHQLTVAIKYWRLVQRVRFFDDDAPAPVFRSVLAPGYHPDYVNRGIPTNISANEDYYEQQDDRSPEAIKIYNASLAAYYDRTRDCPQPGSLP